MEGLLTTGPTPSSSSYSVEIVFADLIFFRYVFLVRSLTISVTTEPVQIKPITVLVPQKNKIVQLSLNFFFFFQFSSFCNK